MNTNYFDEIFKEIENVLSGAPVAVNLSTELKEESYPVVICDEIVNDTLLQTTCNLEVVDLFGIQVDIYCGEIFVDNTLISGRTYARYLTKLIDDVCSKKYRMLRSMSPTPNVDDSIYRITLRYTCKVSGYRNLFY